jgi:phosphoheptose isomerase
MAMSNWTHLDESSDALSTWRSAIVSELRRITSDIIDARVVWILGNGGSQAVAEHWATDFAKVRPEGIYIAPASNAALATMVSNDYEKATWFQHMIAGRTGRDCVICLSTSGESENLLVASNWAVCPRPSPLHTDAANVISGPPTSVVSYGPAALEDIFTTIGHAIAEVLRG